MPDEHRSSRAACLTRV